MGEVPKKNTVQLKGLAGRRHNGLRFACLRTTGTYILYRVPQPLLGQNVVFLPELKCVSHFGEELCPSIYSDVFWLLIEVQRKLSRTLMLCWQP